MRGKLAPEPKGNPLKRHVDEIEPPVAMALTCPQDQDIPIRVLLRAPGGPRAEDDGRETTLPQLPEKARDILRHRAKHGNLPPTRPRGPLQPCRQRYARAPHPN